MSRKTTLKVHDEVPGRDIDAIKTIQNKTNASYEHMSYFSEVR